MRPAFATLDANYPRRKDVSADELLKTLGWDDLVGNAYWANTCAIRVSLALVRSNFPLPGRMAINTGSLKGKRIEPGQGKLARILSRPSMLGNPEKFTRHNVLAGVGNRNGIAAFFTIHPDENDTQGHIDIVSGSNGGIRTCGTQCYWGSNDIWFWELK